MVLEDKKKKLNYITKSNLKGTLGIFLIINNRIIVCFCQRYFKICRLIWSDCLLTWWLLMTLNNCFYCSAVGTIRRNGTVYLVSQNVLKRIQTIMWLNPFSSKRVNMADLDKLHAQCRSDAFGRVKPLRLTRCFGRAQFAM